MGTRRLNEHESTGLRLMLAAKYRGGQDPDTLADDAHFYLVARGWTRRAATTRAHDAAREAIASVDGVAGPVPS